MAYIFLVHAPEDKSFAAKLSGDLTQANIPNWYSDAADETSYYQNLQKATHVVAILSPAALTAEQALGALEFARQNQLERIALRLAEMSTLPPQISGILPLDFSDADAYAENLETLLADLRVEPPAPAAELPREVLDQVYSTDPVEREAGIAALGKYRDASEDLKRLAQEELSALAFRERDGTLKQLAHLAIKALDGEDVVEDVVLPSKEELQEQAAELGVNIFDEPLAPATHTIHLWETNRWQIVLGFLGIVLGGMMLFIGGDLLYAIPVLLVGFLLPQFNVTIRSGGTFEWPLPGSLLGNMLLALLLAGISAAALGSISPDMDTGTFAISVVVGVLFGAFMGWLATLKFEVASH